MQPRLEVRHLALLDALGRVGSLSGAAEVLGVTQSALSHRLREAERRLGTKLCRRKGRMLLLTPAGERLRISAKRLIDDLLRVEADVAHLSEQGITQVAMVGQRPYGGLHWLPPFHAWARRNLPEVKVEVAGDVGESGPARLLDGSLDLLIAPGWPRHPGLRFLPLAQDSLVAVAPPDHPWRDHRVVTPEMLVGETYLAYGYEIAPDLENRRFMRPANCFPDRVQKLGHPDAVLEMVAAGAGVSILARWPIGPWLRRGEVIDRPLLPRGAAAPGLSLDWSMALRAGDGPAAAGSRLAVALQAWAKESGAFG